MTRFQIAIPLLMIAALSGCSSPLSVGQQASRDPVVAEEVVPLEVGSCPWPSFPPADEVSAGLNDVEETEALALDEDLFWSAIESIPDLPDRADFDRLSSALAGCSIEELVAFEARLTLALYALDGPRNLAWFEENDPTGFGFVSDDVFLYARCATVLGGRGNWSDAVAEGTLDWGDDSPDIEGDAEYLLYVAARAAEVLGIDPDTWYSRVFEEVTLSYETGSNAELWR